MNTQMVDQYIMMNQKYFPSDKLFVLKERLCAMDEQRYQGLLQQNLKDPVISLVLSLFLGGLGVDRFFVGDIGMGVLKLLTGGIFGVLTIIDWFLIMGRTRNKNFENIMQFTY